MKIHDKIQSCIERNQLFYSFEYFPPKTQAGIENLFTRMDTMAELEPLFCDVTWGTGDSNNNTTLNICGNAQKYCGLEMMMHLTCTNMSLLDIRQALNAAKEAGVQNILALRGDVPNTNSIFLHAVDLVKFIKKEYGDTFGIAVAGHPDIHIEAKSAHDDVMYLKEKVQAGADFILTQLFYDVESYFTFESKCRKVGITCPIIPGIMPIQNYNGFLRMTSYCNTNVPEDILARLEPIENNDEAVKEVGIEIVSDMCLKLLKGGVIGLHFYTLNLERSVKKILEKVGLLEDRASRRELPWRPSTHGKRSSESVRPIFWANRPKSYLHRTSSWDPDEFSNGRWGDNRSPAFGELPDSHYSPFSALTKVERKALWGEHLLYEKDVFEVFVKYITGSLTTLPWCESALHLETKSIQEKLVRINRSGYLTINSQPRVCGAKSDDPLFGWGGPGGYVYQKAYVECFVSPRNLKLLMDSCSETPSIQYLAVDVRGNTYSNGKKVRV